LIARERIPVLAISEQDLVGDPVGERLATLDVSAKFRAVQTLARCAF
jgi:hypothetical protein